MLVVPFLDELSIQSALSQSRVSLTYLDLSRKQTLQDFQQILHPEISYRGEDCLILFNDTEFALLEKQRWLDLSSAEQIGWYSEDQHATNERLLRNLDPQRFENLHQKNPQLKFANFALLRDPQKLLKQLNVLNGGLGLCYYQFREDYDGLFSRMDLKDDAWLLPRNLLNPNQDYSILAQLLLLEPSSQSHFRKTLFYDNPGIIILQTLLQSSYEFFVSQSFSISDYFTRLQTVFEQSSNTRVIADNLRTLYDGYVKKGLSGYERDRLSSAVKSFIDLAKNDIPELAGVLRNKPDIPRTSLFLLGMMHRADHIEKQFEFGNFIPSFVELFSSSVGGFTTTPDDIVVSFKNTLLHDKHVRKLQYINQYILEIKKRSEMMDDIKFLQKITNRRLREAEVRLLEREIHNIDSEINSRDFALNMESQNRQLQDTLAQRDQQIALLRRDIAALQGSKTEVLQELNRKNDDILALQSTIQKQFADIEEKRKEIDSNQSEIATNRQTIADLSSEIGQREITIRQQDNTIQTLQASLSDTQSRLHALLDQHTKLLERNFAREHWFLKLVKPTEFGILLTEMLSNCITPFRDKSD